MLEALTIHCPYCGEGFETTVDLSAGSQSYIEDCAVCWITRMFCGPS